MGDTKTIRAMMRKTHIITRFADQLEMHLARYGKKPTSVQKINYCYRRTAALDNWIAGCCRGVQKP